MTQTKNQSSIVRQSIRPMQIISYFCAIFTLFYVNLSASGAHADCVPTVSKITASQTSASVGWLETCPGPSEIQILRNGDAPNYQNGQLFGILQNLTAFENSGVVATNKLTLAPNTDYTGVRLCAVYIKSPSPLIYCTSPFSIKTMTAPPVIPPVTLKILSTSSTPTTVSFSWSTPSNFQSYHVQLNDGNEQTLSNNGSSFTYGNGNSGLTPSTRYKVAVEGCVYHGISGNTCTNQFVAAYITTQAAPPPVPVTSKQYSINPMSAGDCTLKDGSVTFRSDGTFSFSAQVRTNHTTTSDYWHVSFELLDNAGHGISSVPEFTGPAMKDAHPTAYSWSQNGNFDSSAYGGLVSLRVSGRC